MVLGPPKDFGRTIAHDGWTVKAEGFGKSSSEVKARPPAPAPIPAKVTPADTVQKPSEK